jgi:hypothetical protein
MVIMPFYGILGGSVERWEDAEYRRCFEQVLQGGDAWRQLDLFDASPRLNANSDLYHAGCIFPPFLLFRSLINQILCAIMSI